MFLLSWLQLQIPDVFQNIYLRQSETLTSIWNWTVAKLIKFMMLKPYKNFRKLSKYSVALIIFEQSLAILWKLLR